MITCEKSDSGLTSYLYSGPCRSAGDRRLTGRQWSVGEESGEKHVFERGNPETVGCMDTLNIYSYEGMHITHSSQDIKCSVRWSYISKCYVVQ